MKIKNKNKKNNNKNVLKSGFDFFFFFFFFLAEHTSGNGNSGEHTASARHLITVAFPSHKNMFSTHQELLAVVKENGFR